MEKIKINEIEKRAAKNGKPFWVVRYVGGEATIGAWDAQLADYIEKDVGIGGSVSVVITQKGDYTNITEVDMTSGVKGEPSQETPAQNESNAGKESFGRTPEEMVAAEILKGAVELTKTLIETMKLDTTNEDIGRMLAANVNELTGAYKLALSNVKAL